MLRFGETKIAKETLYAAEKTINIWDVKGNAQFVQKVIFEPLIDFKQNHY